MGLMARALCALWALLLSAAPAGGEVVALRGSDAGDSQLLRPLSNELSKEAMKRKLLQLKAQRARRLVSRKLQNNFGYVSGTLHLIGHINADEQGNRYYSSQQVKDRLIEVLTETIEEVTGETVQRMDLHEISRGAATVMCDSFMNLGVRQQMGFYSSVTGAFFSLGYSGEAADVDCTSDSDSLTLTMENEPINFNTGQYNYCHFYHPEYLENLAAALGYNRFEVLETMQDSRGCDMMYLNNCGLVGSASGDEFAWVPNKIRFYELSTRQNVEFNYQVTGPVGREFLPMQTLMENGEPPVGNGVMRRMLTDKMSEDLIVQHLNTRGWCVKTDRFAVGPTSTTTVAINTGPTTTRRNVPQATTTSLCKPWLPDCTTTVPWHPCGGVPDSVYLCDSDGECWCHRRNGGTAAPVTSTTITTTTTTRERCYGLEGWCQCSDGTTSCDCQTDLCEIFLPTTTTDLSSYTHPLDRAAEDEGTSHTWFIGAIAVGVFIFTILTISVCIFVMRMPQGAGAVKAFQNSRKKILVTGWGATTVDDENIDASINHVKPKLSVYSNTSDAVSHTGSNNSPSLHSPHLSRQNSKDSKERLSQWSYNAADGERHSVVVRHSQVADEGGHRNSLNRVSVQSGGRVSLHNPRPSQPGLLLAKEASTRSREVSPAPSGGRPVSREHSGSPRPGPAAPRASGRGHLGEDLVKQPSVQPSAQKRTSNRSPNAMGRAPSERLRPGSPSAGPGSRDPSRDPSKNSSQGMSHSPAPTHHSRVSHNSHHSQMSHAPDGNSLRASGRSGDDPRNLVPTSSNPRPNRPH